VFFLFVAPLTIAAIGTNPRSEKLALEETKNIAKEERSR